MNAFSNGIYSDADLEIFEFTEAAGWAFCPTCGDEFRLRRTHPGPKCNPGGEMCEFEQEIESV